MKRDDGPKYCGGGVIAHNIQVCSVFHKHTAARIEATIMTNTRLHSYERRDGERYYTLEADRLVPLLNRFFPVLGKVHECAAGAGHLSKEIARLPSVTDVIETDAMPAWYASSVWQCRIEDLDGSIAPDWCISSLPYTGQDALISHLLKVYPNAWHAYLVRWNFLPPKKRNAIIHSNPRFAGVVVSAKRPRWIEGSAGSPAVDYCFAVWRPIGAPVTAPTIHFEGAAR